MVLKIVLTEKNCSNNETILINNQYLKIESRGKVSMLLCDEIQSLVIG